MNIHETAEDFSRRGLYTNIVGTFHLALGREIEWTSSEFPMEITISGERVSVQQCRIKGHIGWVADMTLLEKKKIGWLFSNNPVFRMSGFHIGDAVQYLGTGSTLDT